MSKLFPDITKHRRELVQVVSDGSAKTFVYKDPCTRWGSLLKGHPQWQYEPPTAADCYRYVLHNSAVSLALTAPQSEQQLAENLSVLHAPKLSPSEIAHWQKYGNLIYGNGKDAFETQWL